MKWKIYKYGIIILLIINILVFFLLMINKKVVEKEIANEYKETDEQIVQVLSIDNEDSNIIGYISINNLGIEKAPIADGTSNEIIDKYVGHFKETSYIDGNVCLCSHNRGSKATFFSNLKNAKEGMIIEYITKFETKQYKIVKIEEIDETNLSVLEPTENNQITLITCVENKRDKRLCVIGTEI